jgi:hypothetical protein
MAITFHWCITNDLLKRPPNIIKSEHKAKNLTPSLKPLFPFLSGEGKREADPSSAVAEIATEGEGRVLG